MRLILAARICRFAVLILILTGLTLSALATDHPPLPGAADGVATSDLAQLSIEELMQIEIPTVLGASKHEQKVTEAPSSVTIITADDFKKFGYRTLSDALRSVRGTYVTYDRAYNYVGFRGVNRPGDYGGGVLMMIDGHRLNDPVADQAFNGGEFPLDVDLIDRVEVIRGPGSSLYGNNAFFGVVNVITRRGRDAQGVEASGSTASFDADSGRLSYGQRFKNGAELLMSGTYFDSEGPNSLYYPDFSSINNGQAEHLDGERRGNAFVSLSYRDFTLEGVYGHRVKSLPTAAYGTIFNVAPNEVLDERAFVELRYNHEFASTWLVEARVYYDYYFYEGSGPVDGADIGLPEQAVMNNDRSNPDWWGGGVQASKTFFEKHRLTAGVEGRADLKVRQYNYYEDPLVVVNDIDTPSDTIGLYLQDEFRIWTNLLLNAGVRYDQYSTFGDTVNPRAGLIYSPCSPTTFKLLYGQAYRAPNAYEFAYNAVGYVANSDIKPETIRSYELVWEQRLSRPLRLSAGVFYNQIADQITQLDESDNPDVGGWIFRNVGEAEIKGFETELEGRWVHGLRGHISYTFADATDSATGAQLDNSPRHVGKFGLVVPLYKEKVFAGAELQAMSDRKTVQGNESDEFVVANLTIFSHELLKNLELSASLYNLFDTKYADPAGPDFTQDTIEQDGRTFRVKATYRF